MRPDLFRDIGKLLSLIAILLFIGLLITLSSTSFPASQGITGAYPGPEEIILTSTKMSPEALCDHWFSYRKRLSEEKRAIAEEEYLNCVNARKTPSPVGVTKAVPSAPPGGINSSVFVSRPAGTGTILEAGYSPFNSTYRIINQWYGDIDELQMYVFAGGQRSGPASGNDGVNEPAWPGMVVLEVHDSKGNYLIEKGGQFRPPQEAGPVRIVDAKGTQLILVAQDGTAFAFDVMRRQFVAEKLTSPISRSVGAGMLVESGNVPYNLAGFEFVNYWYHQNKDLSRTVVMAGSESNNPQSGTLVVAVSSPSTDSEPIQALAFNTSMSDGYLRIADGDGEKLILVSAEDLVYEFNLASLEFASLRSGSAVISVMPIKLETPSSEPGLIFSSPTPGATTTPRPTLTRLPTVNPYP